MKSCAWTASSPDKTVGRGTIFQGKHDDCRDDVGPRAPARWTWATDGEADKGFGEAGLIAALLSLERQQAMQRALDGMGQLLKEQTDLLRGMRDRNQMGPGGGLSSEIALEAFKTLDHDKDGDVTRMELDRHLGLAGQAPGLPKESGRNISNPTPDSIPAQR
jgi:hypothetical protein